MKRERTKNWKRFLALFCAAVVGLCAAAGGAWELSTSQVWARDSKEEILARYPISSSVKSKAAKRTFLFVGDSYATTTTERTATPWPERFCKALGIKASEQMYARKGKYGFAPSSGKTFAKLVSKKESSKKITDVVIMGGIGNDMHSSMTKIRKGAKKLNTYLRKKYPNARIIYAVCNWCYGDAARQKIESERYSLYRQMALANGWIYLEGLETILHGHLEYFWSDKHHPNSLGSMVIGYAMAYAYGKICLSKVEINHTALTIKKGSSKKLSVTFSSSAMKKAGVTWKTSKSSVVSVSENGTITAKKAGTAVITAKTKYGGRTVKCAVKVT